MNALYFFPIDVVINIQCRGDTGMAQHLRNGFNVSAVMDLICSEEVAQLVWRQVSYAGALAEI